MRRRLALLLFVVVLVGLTLATSVHATSLPPYAPRVRTGDPAAAAVQGSAPAPPFRVFGYLPEYRQTANFPYEAFFQQGLTHLIFFSVEVDRDTGAFDPESFTDRLPQGDQWRYIRQLADAYDVKLMVCVGGGGRSEGFPMLVSSADNRRAFVRTLSEWFLEKELDGIDFNWEYPQTEKEWGEFGQLLLEVRSGLGYASLPVTNRTAVESMPVAARTAYWRHHRTSPDQTGRRRVRVRDAVLSVALHPHPSLGPILQANKVLRSVDYLHWMAYDSPLEGRPHSGVDYAEATLTPAYLNAFSDAIYYAPRPTSPLHKAAPAAHKAGPVLKVDHRKKVTLGIPFYGRVTNNLAANPETYERLVYFIRQWARKEHPEWREDGMELRTMNTYAGYNFNSYADVQKKMQLARTLALPHEKSHGDEPMDTGIGGIMLWELGQDLHPPSTQPLSLMRAIGDQLRTWAGAGPYTPFTAGVPPPTQASPSPTQAGSGDDGDDDDGRGDL